MFICIRSEVGCPSRHICRKSIVFDHGRTTSGDEGRSSDDREWRRMKSLHLGMMGVGGNGFTVKEMVEIFDKANELLFSSILVYLE